MCFSRFFRPSNKNPPVYPLYSVTISPESNTHDGNENILSACAFVFWYFSIWSGSDDIGRLFCIWNPVKIVLLPSAWILFLFCPHAPKQKKYILIYFYHIYQNISDIFVTFTIDKNVINMIQYNHREFYI